jgi:hypothetical protein
MSALRVKSGTAKQKEGSGTTAAPPSESYVLASEPTHKGLINSTMTVSSPMSVQAKGEQVASVPIQTPKAMIPTEIKSESTVSMIVPFF